MTEKNKKESGRGQWRERVIRDQLGLLFPADSSAFPVFYPEEVRNELLLNIERGNFNISTFHVPFDGKKLPLSGDLLDLTVETIKKRHAKAAEIIVARLRSRKYAYGEQAKKDQEEEHDMRLLIQHLLSISPSVPFESSGLSPEEIQKLSIKVLKIELQSLSPEVKPSSGKVWTPANENLDSIKKEKRQLADQIVTRIKEGMPVLPSHLAHFLKPTYLPHRLMI